MLNTDLEKQGTFPSEVEAFRRKILDTDSILFASLEYNFSITAPLKNAMDWGSRPPNVWGGKAAGIVSAGGLLGGARGQFHLRQIGIFIDLHFLNKPEFFLNAFEPPPKFNPLNGDLTDEDAKLRLKQMLLSLKAFTLQLHHNN
ncbi:hypothetical protein QN277_002056 [Acacia crassicarpa]|uniref:NAD(P)H dehydrogenase (quinone) n=1 Tax=Acacia crassicarpa TaxID=499986 RepID=A0AAE1THG5_9FABA|nr:hypothetical protein QN277_002056 [Acacia crassicarpa]